jgi:hypothetical protein
MRHLYTMKELKKIPYMLAGEGDDYSLITRLPVWVLTGFVFLLTSCSQDGEESRDYLTTYFIVGIVMTIIIVGMVTMARKKAGPSGQPRPKAGPGETKNTAGPGANRPMDNKNP